MADEVEISELEEFEPSRVDGVGKAANGFPILMMKAVDGEIVEIETDLETALDEIDKADAEDDRPDCATCKGKGTIMEGHRKCPKCQGSGKQPMVGDSAKASAASGAPVPVRQDCPTCNGSGTIADGSADGKMCPDCDGSGHDGTMPPDDKLNAQNAFAGSMDDGNGRTTVDKAEKYVQADRDKMADSGQAMPDGAYPVKDAEDLDNAIHAVGRGGADHDKIRQHIMDRAKALNMSSKIPENWNADGSLASKGVIEKDGITSGPNPFLMDLSGMSGNSDSDTGPAPGTPDWEAADAEMATSAAQALMQAAELIRSFADREAIEVAAGEGNDLFDTWDAEMALDAVTSALGIIARLAFHEGVAAQKSVDETEAVEKQNKRLSGKSVTAIAAARDHLSALLGDDDPAKESDDDDASKSIKEIEDMTADELIQLLDARDAQRAEKAMNDAQDVDNSNSIANAKNANNKAKKKMPKADMTDLEDEADQGDNDSASSPASGAAKAELTPEEIEAREHAKEAKKALKAAKRAEKQAAENAAVAKAIEEGVAKAEEAVKALQDRLATVEKMAAPSSVVKTRPQGADVKAAERDATEMRIAALEHEARNTTDPAVRAGNREIIKELRTLATQNN